MGEAPERQPGGRGGAGGGGAEVVEVVVVEVVELVVVVVLRGSKGENAEPGSFSPLLFLQKCPLFYSPLCLSAGPLQ